MALITCPECDNQVSDAAYCCPHCGFPVNDAKSILNSSRRKRETKKKRLPNGFGSITELKGRNLREPFFARITIGKNNAGRPILAALKPKAYFATYNDAYTALALYHANPYKIEDSCTVQQLYEKWIERYFKTLKNKSAQRTTITAWSYVDEHIKRQQVRDLTITALKDVIDNAHKIDDTGKLIQASDNIKARIKSTFNLMYDFAVESQLVTINISRQFSIKGLHSKIERNRKDKNPIIFEHEQILWDNIDLGCTRMILINIYSSWRPDELVKIKLDNVDLEKRTMIGGEKTDAGTDRIVPIHPKIFDLVQYYYNISSKYNNTYLFFDSKYYPDKIAPLTYDQYRHRFNDICNLYKWDTYSPSCPRHTFATKAKSCNVDKMALKLMMGHEIKDVTEKHYTHMDLDHWLMDELIKIE